MTTFHDRDYWQVELKRLLDIQEPESLHLDYKDKRSIIPPRRGGQGIDKQKRAEDVSKDISSFLNSDGGVLIYGVPETTDPSSTGGAPIPLAQSTDIGFTPEDKVDKETIENLITSGIQPIPKATLFQIAEVDHLARNIFVVEVKPGIGDVWQAKDKRYYERFHYKAEPMDHYRIEMVKARMVGPNLSLAFGFNDRWEREISDDAHEVTIFVGIRNDSTSVAEAALIELGVAGNLTTDGYGQESLGPFTRVGAREVQMDPPYLGRFDWYECYWPVGTQETIIAYRPVFRTNLPLRVTRLSVKGPFTQPSHLDAVQGWLFWRIQSPNMAPKKGVTEVVKGRYGLKLEELRRPFEIQ